MTTENTEESGWYVRRGGQVRGPFTSAKVRRLVLDGRLKLEDEVSDDRERWRAISAEPEVVPLQLRRDKSIDEQDQARLQRQERRLAVWVLAGVALIIAGVFTLALLFGPAEESVQVDCSAPAAPGINWSGCGLDGRDLIGATLAGAQLANISAQRVQLASAELAGADLSYANLTEATLAYADLRDATLRGAILRQADLTNADLSGADLSFADLSGAKLGGALLANTLIRGTLWPDGKPCPDTRVIRCPATLGDQADAD